MSAAELSGWDRLRHGGLLLDPPRLRRIAGFAPRPLTSFDESELRKQATAVLDGGGEASPFVAFVLERICGFGAGFGDAAVSWQRGSQIGPEWGRRAVTGEVVKPRHLWRGPNGAVLPVFIVDDARLGIGRGRRSISQLLQWLRGGGERLALLTNGRQWRLVFATLDIDAWCEWDADLWFEEGGLSPQVEALRTLLQPAVWTPAPPAAAPLVEAILESRKGQADLSAVLGERVREAVEMLVQGHGEALQERCAGVDPADIYRAAVRVVMRMVVVLFAESRELLPRDNAIYHGAYGLTGLLEELEKVAARGGQRLARSWSAWPRVLALFRLVYEGSHHQALPVPAYGGELFAPGDPASPDGVSRALASLEGAAFDSELLSDRDVHRVLDRITRTRVRLRQGRSSTWMPAPVDFSDLSTEYIGILYEGLLDFELKTAPPGDPVIFLALGNQPALPLSRLEAMDDKALANLLEKMKDTSTADEEGGDDGEAESAERPDAADDDQQGDEETAEADASADDADDDDQDAGQVMAQDARHVTRTRAETWARRAVVAGKLVSKPRGTLTPEKRSANEQAIGRKARQLVSRVVLPGEWYLVRWGGTRKGSGTFYTRPGLAVPTVQRTLRPLAYDPPLGADGTPDRDAPARAWTPKPPEAILALKVCDPGCGSGTFPVAAMRFLTEALYASLHPHGRIRADGERSVVKLLAAPGSAPEGELLREELLPCRPDDPIFEARLKAILRRHVVERCICGVDLDPLAVELCRLALWVETMDRDLPFSFLDHKIKCGNSLVGAWFDQFQHYPVMAWKNREGGDKNHTNGVHFAKEERTKAIKAFVADRLTLDLRDTLSGQMRLFAPPAASLAAVHDDALALLQRLHELPVQDAAERARVYREELVGSPAYRALKAAMDLWCACWFWPADDLDHAPLPSSFAAPPPETRAIADRIAAAKRFFHWELEFPDVFRSPGSGFDAILGNPPWDIAKPNSKEFFSNIDPLYRAYGKQEALGQQTAYFADRTREGDWLAFNAVFSDYSNWMKFAAHPFGDGEAGTVSQVRFTIAKGKAGQEYHAHWRQLRKRSLSYSDPLHPFRHQGEGKAYTYKLFLDAAHNLLGPGGRIGFIVPSGLYSDHGSGALRQLFLDHCRWEWLFGFENREKVFEIDSRFKFNPVIVEKGGTTAAIRTAFMRRKLEDWERAEDLATPYTREQVDRFSPRSKAILEIQSARDLEILTKIYSNSVLLGDDGPDGWGITYAQGDFNMTSDSRLFPPRPKWEADGYRPDEYSRWLKGDWRPIPELWAELGIDPSRVVPTEVELEDWLFDTTASPERRQAEARFVHGHLLKPGDVARTPWRLRCAQPPYDTLPIPRADIPPGIILSRAADAWIREDRTADIAVPLWQGVMISGLSTNVSEYRGGAGHRAVWHRYEGFTDNVNPQFLISPSRLPDEKAECAVGFRALARATDSRTFISAVLGRWPCGNSIGILATGRGKSVVELAAASSASFVYDWTLRRRIAGTNINSFFLWETGWPSEASHASAFSSLLRALTARGRLLPEHWLSGGATNQNVAWRSHWAATASAEMRCRVILDALAAASYGLDMENMRYVLADTDWPPANMLNNAFSSSLDARGFWRVDKESPPELRHPVLTLVAFHILQQGLSEIAGDRPCNAEALPPGIGAEGWMLPETLRLADSGLGHDDRAKEYQPVASRLGPRFYDWQLAQTVEESWRECRVHGRNLLGETAYKHQFGGANSSDLGSESQAADKVPSGTIASARGGQGSLFD